MKLPTPVQTSMSRYDFTDQLEKQGYKCIGGGAFSEVYAIPKTPYVCKVGYACSSFRNDPYVAFLRSIDPTNPLFPEIKSIGLFYQDSRHSGNEYYVVHMEKLTEYERISKAKVKTGLSKYRMSCLYELEEWYLRKRGIKSNDKSFKQAVDVLRRLYNRYDEDIHEGNVMWRNARCEIPQLVITDPIA